ncbi:MAG: hypothetical protein EXR93_02380 [Gemmatimonadetes bacterium]|nr:hypothetical protein [Gemmatimonadota bacterium]
MKQKTRLALSLLLGIPSCGGRASSIQPIFVEGHAVTMAGDSLFAVTLSGQPGLLIRNRATGKGQMIGTAVLHNPAHAQWFDGTWYVSDVENGRPEIAVLAADGTLKERIALGGVTNTPHQFAVMPGGEIVVEGQGGKLVMLKGGKTSTYAETESSGRTGLLVAAGGGVVHGIPDKYVTLYNGFGHIRWRIDWPWAKTAFISDIAVDYNGRIHLIGGVPRDGTFVVYTLSTATGEVVRWSIPGPKATFTVNVPGNLEPTDAAQWTKVGG